MTYPDTTRRFPARDPPSRSAWWRHYLAIQSRRIAESRMRFFYLFGAIVVVVAAVFLVPMFVH